MGGERGRAALDAAAERDRPGGVLLARRRAPRKAFEIVRRRLVRAAWSEKAQFVDAGPSWRGSSHDLYRTQHQEFPPECRDAGLRDPR